MKSKVLSKSPNYFSTLEAFSKTTNYKFCSTYCRLIILTILTSTLSCYPYQKIQRQKLILSYFSHDFPFFQYSSISYATLKLLSQPSRY